MQTELDSTEIFFTVQHKCKLTLLHQFYRSKSKFEHFIVPRRMHFVLYANIKIPKFIISWFIQLWFNLSGEFMNGNQYNITASISPELRHQHPCTEKNISCTRISKGIITGNSLQVVYSKLFKRTSREKHIVSWFVDFELAPKMWFDALVPINAGYKEMKDVIKSDSRIVDEISPRFEVYF